MNIVFIMDPLETVKVDKDTTLGFMVAARESGHRTFYCPNRGLALGDRRVEFHGEWVTASLDAAQPFVREGPSVLTQDDVDAIFLRTDPPFDAQYLMNTWLLDLLPSHIPVINAPSGVRTVNEKIWVNRFTEWIPETRITRFNEDFQDFYHQYGAIILKPVNGYGGQSVFYLRQGDPNARVAFETLSHGGAIEVILQPYLSAASQGDKRILLLNGELLGAVLRVHGESDHRNNFMAGGSPVACAVTEREHRMINDLSPHLRRLGLYFVGLDVIGDYLVEVNVTSPTCLREMEKLGGGPLAAKVIAFVEQLVHDGREGKGCQ